MILIRSAFWFPQEGNIWKEQKQLNEVTFIKLDQYLGSFYKLHI